ncbi:bis(5'-nucleosyl)-tetraphosphatase (symmetrical) YqeK [Acetobacterium sp.]|jgi:predicted HD superfamily hydrolase involved in NAD metabolism|uniref:bis(5'-nucleosyl)-tetraphosphatase (symmetrical) YqeK n=1 Tax=Acetobacterium sp. TaxID=1872094 RepID=UPI0027167DD6|nr:bis(5'-nucleosyl)-tetraphosphatase (symmetrical) YqeK [Acetobacterium sp.]MDO9493831.1 bis(5'-nucleosyl)-tetraphosphatase (symmetrical) YqeK [Acetobacterium sp.]
MNWTDIEADLKKNLTPKRFRHTMNVVAAADKMARDFGCNLDQARLAALLHDCAKNLTDQQQLDYAQKHQIKIDRISHNDPQLLHGPVGAVLAKERYGIDDAAIQNAIDCHTTGCKNMNTLDKIIYLADYIEKDRSFPEVETIRQMAETDLDGATIMALTNCICHVAQTGALIHKRTIDARNDLIIKQK